MKKLGVCYYPEHWSEACWKNDAQQMYDLGIRWVRLAEFSWSKIEPEAGQYHWEWLDRAMDIFAEQGIDVVLGTPTATPPHWLVKRHPDMLAVDKAGDVRTFGSRRHYDFSHQGYRQMAADITCKMAARYANHPALAAWQVDNEFACHDTARSYSPTALTGFQVWLKKHYANISALNEAWGNVFWSMDYADFTDINLPNHCVTEANPAHWQDFYRYASDAVIEFSEAMTASIREHDAVHPLIHNYMGLVHDFDHYKLGQQLDIASWDSYPLGYLLKLDTSDDEKLKYRCQGEPDFQAFYHDLYREVGQGRCWVMEQQPGPVNWAAYNAIPLPGMVRLWTLEAFAHGAEVVSYFRWRQAPFAQEQLHAGLQLPNGMSAPVTNEVKQVYQELLQIKDWTTAPAEIAIVFDYESAWAWEVQPQGESFTYFALVYAYYKAIRALGFSVDIINPQRSDLNAYKMVVIAGLFAWPKVLNEAIENYTGHAVIGPRTGSKTQNFSIPTALPPDQKNRLDLHVIQVESLPDYASVLLSEGGHVIRWREQVAVGEDVSVLEYMQADWPLVCEQQRMFYIAAWLDQAALQRVLHRLADAIGLNSLPLPDGVRLRKAGTQQILFNYNQHAVSLEKYPDLHMMFGVDSIDVAGVLYSMHED